MKDVLIEVGVEEIPARLLEPTLEELEEIISSWLVNINLDPEYPDSETRLNLVGTPRRIVLDLTLPASQQDQKQRLKGPPATVAYDAGDPTQALEGFCRQHDLAVDEVEVESIDGGEYVVAYRTEVGNPVEECLRDDFEELLFSLDFDRQMRWDFTGDRFIRPLRWLMAFVDGSPLELEVSSLTATTDSRGLRFTDSARFEPEGPEDYRKVLQNQGIVLQPAERRREIGNAAESLASKVDGEPVLKPGLLEEVTNLVEAPVPFRGSFDERFLKLPDPVLIKTMVSHQKYIPIEAPGEGQLLNYFVGVRNGGREGLDVVKRGNERVIRARLNDAEFFYDKDLQTDFENYREQLKGVVFQEELGSLFEKTERLARLVELRPELGEDHVRVARHCKNDRVTEMVDEFPALQGVIGKIYARESGWSKELAKLIEEHYQPVDADDSIPGTLYGSWLSLLDRADTLLGFFALGERPTGSRDPYGLRRDALGMLKILLEAEIQLSLPELLGQVRDVYSDRDVELSASALEELLGFVGERFYQYLSSNYNFSETELTAVLNCHAQRPLDAFNRLNWLQSWRTEDDFERVITGARRVMNITDAVADDAEVKPDLFRESVEAQLFELVDQCEGELEEALEAEASDQILAVYQKLKGPIDEYFETVMVNCEDEDLRQSRLATLQKVRRLFERVADFTVF